MVKLVEFSSPVETDLPFDVVDDVIVFMRNDPQFYRKSFFPAVSRVADLHREGKSIDKGKLLSSMVEQGLNEYCKKFNIAKMPDEVFNNDDRMSIIDRIFSEEMEEIQKGEYK
jgi:hypothetical protein